MRMSWVAAAEVPFFADPSADAALIEPVVALDNFSRTCDLRDMLCIHTAGQQSARLERICFTSSFA